jgi:hypothetical protein
MIIKPLGGLCNRLRVLFSYYKYENRLIVVWIVDEECPGKFLDYFEKIKNVIFIYKNINYKIDYTGSEIHPKHKLEESFIYDNLKLLPFIKNKIDNIISKLGNKYISVHIRRSDHTYLAKKHNQFTSYMNFVDFININKDYYIYIATDNRITQYIFYQLYKSKIKLIKFINKINQNRRKTSLEDSIIDLYVCVYSNLFCGTKYSSFTDLIYNLRNNNN